MNRSGYLLSVQQDQYNNGAMCVEWLAANYKNYWADEFDTKDLGLIVLNFSIISGITEREPGCKERVSEGVPGSGSQLLRRRPCQHRKRLFNARRQYDDVVDSGSASGVKKWFVVGLVDDWSMGATRAAEAMGKQADVLVTSVQADAFINEMKTGNLDSIYCAACAVSSSEFAVNMACNLVTILEGRATAETIWPEWIADNGSKYASMKIKGSMITKDTYQEFIDTHTVEALVAAAKNG
jgi:hypothetical protein